MPHSGHVGPSPQLSVAVAADEQRNGLDMLLKSLSADGLLASVPDEQRRLAEQYRVIKRPILRNADPNRDSRVVRGNLLMVASALPGEGKTFTSINLAVSIAKERDWSVLLVDSDCHKRHLSRVLAAEQALGLTDLLREPGINIDSVITPTSMHGLSFLPAGSPGEDTPELLSSTRMKQLCWQLAEQRPSCMIIFDSAPLLLASDASALASHVGQIALVVLANSTPRPAVRAALEKLDSAKAVGCILNQSPNHETSQYGDYSYNSYRA